MVMRLRTLTDASPLCRTFERLSSEVWTTQADAHTYNLGYGEESLTEMILLELKRAHPMDITVAPVNRRVEAGNGADWAWWFKGKQWLGMRVQAKKLSPASRCYEKLAHTVGKSTKLQIDVLLAQSKKDSLYPMYCFYNFWDTTAHPLIDVPFHCQTFAQSEHRMGCTLASAQDVKLWAVDQKKNDLATVAGVSFPWTCLVCCPGGTQAGDDFASRVKAALEIQQHPTPVPEAGQRRRRARRVEAVLVREPPGYVHAAMEGYVDDGDLPQGIAGVAVFKDPAAEKGRATNRKQR